MSQIQWESECIDLSKEPVGVDALQILIALTKTDFYWNFKFVLGTTRWMRDVRDFCIIN